MAQSSNTYSFQPDIATLVLQAYGRIQVRRAQLTIDHLVDARIALNLILADWGANRGVNLAQVDQIALGMVPGVASYQLPGNTVDLLDVYLRTFTPGTSAVDLGNLLVAVVASDGQTDGIPVVSGPYGDPVVTAPGGGVFSCTAGEAVVSMDWPSHRLLQGSPLFFGCPVTLGGLTIGPLQVVSKVIDGNTVEFMLPSPVFETITKGGGTRLFCAQNGSDIVTVIQTGHGLQVGSLFMIPIALTVGGIGLGGAGVVYTVDTVQSLSQFTFKASVQSSISQITVSQLVTLDGSFLTLDGEILTLPGDEIVTVTSGPATETAVAFENSGKIRVGKQLPGAQYQDIPLFPLSRTNYAAIPNKFVPGRPTSYWIDRTTPPVISVYPVPDAAQPWGIIAYRMREMQDAIPAGGQVIDLPKRMWRALLAQLTADVAEIWNPPAWQAKQTLAEFEWTRAASADAERVPLRIRPQLGIYYR